MRGVILALLLAGQQPVQPDVVMEDQFEQARQLIDHAAHPSVRDELREDAAALGLLPTTGRGV